MRRGRKQKVKEPAFGHKPRQEDRHCVGNVLQTMFWYMRLSGLMVPFTCSHDAKFRRKIRPLKRSSTVAKTSSVEMAPTGRIDVKGNQRERTSTRHCLPEAESTESTDIHPVQTGTAKFDRMEETIANTRSETIFTEVNESHRHSVPTLDLKNSVESMDVELYHCPKCQVMLFWSRIFVGVVISLMVFNCVRYSSVFFVMKSDIVHLISFITFQMFFVGITLMYILSAYTLAKQLPRFLEDLKTFEKRYGISVDLSDFRKGIKRKGRFSFALQMTFSLGFVLFEQFVFPSLRIHLAPFHNSEGIDFYFALIYFAAVLNFINAFVYCMFGFLAVATYVLIMEFKNTSKGLRKVLSSAGKVSDPSLHDTPWTRENVFKHSSPSSDTHDDERFRRRRSLQQSLLNSRKSSALATNEKGSHARQKNLLHMTGNVDRNDDTIQHEYCKSDGQQKTHHNSHDDKLSVSAVPATSLQKVDQCLSKIGEKVDQRLSKIGEKLDNPSGEYASLQGNEDVAVREVTQEMNFDLFRAKHQMLCELVAGTNRCIRHFMSIGFGGCFPLICLIIYVLSSQSLDVANILFLSYNLLYTKVFLVLTVVLALMLHDAAHGAQDVIFAADWSQFSDRLLTKVQLFVSRLGHSQIGYDVYGLFVIDRSTVLMVTGTLVTYTVVVIQFQQGDVTTTCYVNATAVP